VRLKGSDRKIRTRAYYYWQGSPDPVVRVLKAGRALDARVDIVKNIITWLRGAIGI
jgi:hypothetical protein